VHVAQKCAAVLGQRPAPDKAINPTLNSEILGEMKCP
jgi:hypothetical protein